MPSLAFRTLHPDLLDRLLLPIFRQPIRWQKAPVRTIEAFQGNNPVVLCYLPDVKGFLHLPHVLPPDMAIEPVHQAVVPLAGNELPVLLGNLILGQERNAHQVATRFQLGKFVLQESQRLHGVLLAATFHHKSVNFLHGDDRVHCAFIIIANRAKR